MISLESLKDMELKENLKQIGDYIIITDPFDTQYIIKQDQDYKNFMRRFEEVKNSRNLKIEVMNHLLDQSDKADLTSMLVRIFDEEYQLPLDYLKKAMIAYCYKEEVIDQELIS